MARGGYRPGAGRPKGSTNKPKITPAVGPAAKRTGRKTVAAALVPLDYMLGVMNDAEADGSRRDRMAIAAAPYLHPKADENKLGKRQQQRASAERAAGGKFATPSAPKLVVDNRR